METHIVASLGSSLTKPPGWQACGYGNQPCWGKMDYKNKPLFFSTWFTGMMSWRYELDLAEISDWIIQSVNTLVFLNILCYLTFLVLSKTMNTAFFYSWRFLHVNPWYPLLSHVQIQNSCYGENIVCGAGHTFAVGIQDDEKTSKLRVGCIPIYLYANISFLLENIFFIFIGVWRR